VPLYKIRSQTFVVAYNKMGIDLEMMICGKRKNNIVCGKWFGFLICDRNKGGKKITV
jgi:hypothetical protein